MLRNASRRQISLWSRNVQVSRVATTTTRLTLRTLVSGPTLQSEYVKGLIPRSLTKHRVFSTSEGEKSPNDSVEDPTSPIAWLSMLENTTSSPWLLSRPPTPERILERAFILILQILLALNAPREPEAARAFFFAFENAPVSSTSDIGRGRRAVGILTRVVVDDMASIPMTASVRQQFPQVFALHDALVPLCEMHLRDPSDNIEDWKAFWSRIEGPLFQLNTELDTAGFGLDLEKIMEAQKAEEAAAEADAAKSGEPSEDKSHSSTVEDVKK